MQLINEIIHSLFCLVQRSEMISTEMCENIQADGKNLIWVRWVISLILSYFYKPHFVQFFVNKIHWYLITKLMVIFQWAYQCDHTGVTCPFRLRCKNY